VEAPVRGYFIGCLKMNDIEEKLSAALEEVISAKGMRIVNINISNSSSSPSIKVIIDSSKGVGLEDCAFTSKLADDLIKINNYFEDYDIEVSSPGINRQLFSITDFMLYKGFMVKIKLKSSMNNQKNFIGKIKDIAEEDIKVELDDSEIIINFKNIKKANIQEI
jgi:ribosome maturation factor RimP